MGVTTMLQLQIHLEEDVLGRGRQRDRIWHKLDLGLSSGSVLHKLLSELQIACC